jgi:opacity protein-like surface antigen
MKQEVNMRKIGLILVMLSLLFCISLHAQGIGIGPQIGIHKSGDAEGSNIMGGVAVRIKLSPALGIEGSIQYRQENYEWIGSDDLKVRSWPIMVTGMIYPLPILYGAVGFGWYNTTFDYPVIDDVTDQQVGWHFGAGVEIPVGPSTKISGDIRYVFIDYEFEDVPGAGVADSDFYVISIGLLFGL